jgi:hypothetical protein
MWGMRTNNLEKLTWVSNWQVLIQKKEKSPKINWQFSLSMKMAKPRIDKSFKTRQHWCKVQISYKDWMQLNHLTWRNWTLTMVHSWLSHMGGIENPNFISHFHMILATIDLLDYLWWETPNLLIACNKTNLGVW